MTNLNESMTVKNKLISNNDTFIVKES